MNKLFVKTSCYMRRVRFKCPKPSKDVCAYLALEICAIGDDESSMYSCCEPRWSNSLLRML
jgi:hypothetical protein